MDTFCFKHPSFDCITMWKVLGEKMIGQILLLYFKDMAFETRFDNLEASNSYNLKGVILSISDYSFATGQK